MIEQNQFSQSVITGQVTLQDGTGVVSARVEKDVATPLVPGEAVTLAPVLGGDMKVIAATANDEEIFGFVARNLKNQDYKAEDAMEVATEGAAIYLKHGAVTVRGEQVTYDVATKAVVPAVAGDKIIGKSLDGAGAVDALGRVFLFPLSTGLAV